MKNIAIHSVPRSGSTWLGNIFNSHPKVKFSYQPLFSYAFKDRINENSTAKEISGFLNDIFFSDDDFINQKEAQKKGLVPIFKKDDILNVNCYKEVRYHHILKNLLDQNNEIKVIGLVRNPLATINSWLKAPREFRADLDWKVEDEWLYAPKKNLSKPEEYNGYIKWKETAILFEELAQKYPNQFYLLKYEDLLSNKINTLNSVFQFCNLDLHDQTKRFLKNSNSKNINNSYSVFKIKKTDDSWKKSLPDYIINYIKEDINSGILSKYL